MVAALTDFSLHLREGEVFGLAGPLTVGAVEFTIDLHARAGKETKSVQAVRPDATPPSRVVLNAAAVVGLWRFVRYGRNLPW